MEENLVEFLRVRDYIMVDELGQGACGKTVLLHDDIINKDFVCKKYCPISETNREELFTNFKREIELLYEIYHHNVVRVFNHFLYPDQFAGYILMEYIDGFEIDNYLKDAPEKTNEVFLQTIDGFRYLETINILHRDIRPQNIMVRKDGIVKIIDLGFGKQIQNFSDFDKSIDLNWWCELPNEFDDEIYNFKTEVYFVGKLFKKIISENGIEHFEYTNTLSRMCNPDPTARTQSFNDVEKEIQSDKFVEIGFNEEQLLDYRNFADEIYSCIIELYNNVVYHDDFDLMQTKLEDAYRDFMLEEYVPDPVDVFRILLVGRVAFKHQRFIKVEVVKNFVRLLKSVTNEQRRIIMANLHSKLDSLPIHVERPDDDLPF